MPTKEPTLDRPVIGDEVRDLAAEIKADEHAARVRDYGPDDAATYEQRVREGADTARHPDPPVRGEPAGTYQVWHRHGNAFRHVANVEAGNYLAAIILPHVRQGDHGSEQVSWLVDDKRPPSFGDKIVDPLGHAHEIYKPDEGGVALRATTPPVAPADYRQMLADAAGRGSNHGQGKEGPER